LIAKKSIPVFQPDAGKYYVLAALSVLFLLTVGTVITVASSLLCYRHLRKNVRALSPKTVKMFRALLNLLIADLVLAMMVTWVGNASNFLAFATGHKNNLAAAIFGMFIVKVYFICTHLLILFYIEPYRSAVLRLFRCKRQVEPKRAGDLM
jgi:hypothetical protein